MEINHRIAHSGNYNAAVRPAAQIQYIVIHYTGNNGDTAAANAAYFANSKAGVSAHYFVDEKEIWQSVDDENTAWHCGTTGTYYHAACRNANSIGVELCAFTDSVGKFCFRTETVQRAAALVQMLMEKYKVPISRVVRHYDVTHKICPRPYVENEAAWQAFLSTIAGRKEEEEMQVIYKTLEAVPAWGKDTICKLIAKGLLNGESDAELNLEHYMLRALVINDRAGIYGE